MKLEQKYFSRAGWKLAAEGVQWMEKSQDELHDKKHVERMMADLDKLLKEEKELREKIDMEQVLLSIVWHDCWKAKRDPRNPVKLWWSSFYEGWGSERIFKKQAKRAGLSKGKRKKIGEAIKKHTWFWKWAKRDLEAKILWDADNLDVWTVERVTPRKNSVFWGKLGKKDRFFIRALIFWLENFLMTRSKKYLYFDWCKNEFVKRKKEFGKELEKALNEYGQILWGKKKRRKWGIFSSH